MGSPPACQVNAPAVVLSMCSLVVMRVQLAVPHLPRVILAREVAHLAGPFSGLLPPPAIEIVWQFRAA